MTRKDDMHISRLCSYMYMHNMDWPAYHTLPLTCRLPTTKIQTIVRMFCVLLLPYVRTYIHTCIFIYIHCEDYLCFVYTVSLQTRLIRYALTKQLVQSHTYASLSYLSREWLMCHCILQCAPISHATSIPTKT